MLRPRQRGAAAAPATEIESGVIGDGLIERLLSEMRYSLAGIVPLSAITGTGYSPQFGQVAAPPT